MTQAEPNQQNIEAPAKHGPTLGLVAGGLSIGLLFVMFYPTLRATAEICWSNDNYSHGLLLPLIAAFFLYDRRQSVLKELGAPDLSLFGLGLLLAAVPLFWLGEVSDIVFVRWLSFFPAAVGLVCLLVGTRAGLRIAPAIGLLFLAKPIPDSLAPKLFNSFQSFAASRSAELLNLFGVPVYLRGNVLELPGMQLLVEEACSGMRSLMALLTVAVIVLLFSGGGVLKLVVVTLSAVLLAVALNVFRVTLTGLIARYVDLETATGFFHGFSGLLIFLFGLWALFLVARWVDRGIQR
ncbi:MAG: exosortase/archaeosortase family protein [Bdellovibrionales bacterium]|nr:exosortase/archaeosortase family protein [Bdellovibrionales bacterium]